MNKRIIIFLLGVVCLGFLGLYLLQQGPVLLLQPPSEERIAFVSDRGGSPDLWTMRADGSDVRPATKDSADDQMPAWSPNGKEIVSVSDRNGKVYQVFISAWDGRYTRILTASEGTKNAPVWNSDGAEITFISGGKVCSVSRTGGREEQLLPPGGVTGLDTPGRSTYAYAAWSPDGKDLLYVRETDSGGAAYSVTRSDLDSYDGGNLNTIKVVAAANLHVAWAGSGSRVAASFMDRQGTSGILVEDMERVEKKDIVTSDPGTGPGKIAWSPDGETIAFELWKVAEGIPNRCTGIYAVPSTGGRPLLIAKGDARGPAWSPGGGRLAYTMMGKNEKRDIWVVNADGTGSVNLTKGIGDNSAPAWSPAKGKTR